MDSTDVYTIDTTQTERAPIIAGSWIEPNSYALFSLMRTFLIADTDLWTRTRTREMHHALRIRSVNKPRMHSTATIDHKAGLPDAASLLLVACAPCKKKGTEEKRRGLFLANSMYRYTMRRDSCVPVLGIFHHVDEKEFPTLNSCRFSRLSAVYERKSVSLYYNNGCATLFRHWYREGSEI